MRKLTEVGIFHPVLTTSMAACIPTLGKRSNVLNFIIIYDMCRNYQ